MGCLQVMESYDMLYGRPPLALQRRMRDVTQRILDMSDWAAFFRMIGFPMPPQETSQRMTGLLRRAWKRSLQKGYHKKVNLTCCRMTLKSIVCLEQQCCELQLMS